MKKYKVITILLISLVLCISNVYAYNFGTNITIYDNRSGTMYGTDGAAYGGPGWWTRTTEDQEVEPGMVPSQIWDLEGFFLNSNNELSMIGGFDFKNGVTEGSTTYKSGSIFIDVNGDAQYGDFSGTPKTNYGYEYVINLQFPTSGSTGTYTVYSGGWTWDPVYYYNVPDSNPWRYKSGGTSVSTGSFTLESGLTNTGFSGLGGNNNHYAVEGIDMSFLPSGVTFTSHFTMECGNDNLMGQGTTSVPEPTSMLLLGLGLVGLAGLGRKFKP